jgi:uncharacterized protein
MTRRPEAPPIETRTTPLPVALRAAGARRTIGGYASVFDSPSENLGGFHEVVSDKAFNKSRGDGFVGVTAKFDHDLLLGTIKGGTLRLAIDSTGLFYEVDLPESRGDVLELVARGDVDNSSFAFETYDDTWGFRDGVALRTLNSVRLIDVSAVTRPAYSDATVGLRSLAAHVDAPIADVIDLSNQNQLRKLFVHTDSPRIETRTKPTLAERRLMLINNRYPGGHPPGGKDGREALLENLGPPVARLLDQRAEVWTSGPRRDAGQALGAE